MVRIFALVFLLAKAAHADPAIIEAVKGEQTGSTWRFDVTISHPDTGWDHYADGWRVLSMDGTVLGTRVLHHPHVNEQPFTRSLSGVDIPADATQIQIEARDSSAGWSDELVTIDLNEPTYTR